MRFSTGEALVALNSVLVESVSDVLAGVQLPLGKLNAIVGYAAKEAIDKMPTNGGDISA